MWSTRALCLGLFVLSILGSVVADITVTVLEQDPSIRYQTVQNGDSASTTWVPVSRSPTACDTPSMMTSRLGDYMTFTFTGTGVSVVGTRGVRGGIINFALDGLNITDFDRQYSQTVCDDVLFQQLGLQNGQHTVVATLVGKATNPTSGQLGGSLQIQRILYTIPGTKESSLHRQVWPIIRAILAFVALNAAAGLAFFLWRKRHPKRRINPPLRRGDHAADREHLIQPRKKGRPILSGFATGFGKPRKRQASQVNQGPSEALPMEAI